jgi:predicted RNA-binding Zn-ribbon protein involved in translation (DUF1610 family)
VADEKSETELVRCEACQEMVKPLKSSSVNLVAATVVTVHACPHCGGQGVAHAGPFPQRARAKLDRNG